MSAKLSATFGPSLGFGNPKYNVTSVIDVLPTEVLSGSIVIKKTTQFASTPTVLVHNTDYFVNELEGTVELAAPVAAGETIIIERLTDKDVFTTDFDDVGYAPAYAAKSRDLQLLYIIQELEAKVTSLESRVAALEA